MKAYSERRKADRAAMATEIEALCREMGVAFTRENEGENSISPRRVMISMEGPRGLRVSTDFDGQSCQPDIFVLAWNIGLNSDARLSDAFGDVNPHHFQKMTGVARGFDNLCHHLRRGFAMAANGTAFDAAREVAAIAKHGTAADRAKQFEAWRAELAASKV